MILCTRARSRHLITYVHGAGSSISCIFATPLGDAKRLSCHRRTTLGPCHNAHIDCSSISCSARPRSATGWYPPSIDSPGCLYVQRRMARSRRRANALSQAALARGDAITDADVLEALRSWRWHQNKIRKNVMQEDQEFVLSDTLGIVRSRDGRLCLTKASREHPDFLTLLCTWVRDARPSSLKEPFVFTSEP
jgi:hypothetical protein